MRLLTEEVVVHDCLDEVQERVGPPLDILSCRPGKVAALAHVADHQSVRHPTRLQPQLLVIKLVCAFVCVCGGGGSLVKTKGSVLQLAVMAVTNCGQTKIFLVRMFSGSLPLATILPHYLSFAQSDSACGGKAGRVPACMFKLHSCLVQYSAEKGVPQSKHPMRQRSCRHRALSGSAPHSVPGVA